MRRWPASKSSTWPPWLLAIGCALAAVASNGTESQQRTPAQWLHAMDVAFRDLDYDGVFSYYTVNRAQQVAASRRSRQVGEAEQAREAGEVGKVDSTERREATLGFGVGSRSAAHLATFRVVHKMVDGVEHERIVHLNGPPREIIRVGEKIHCVLQPGDELQNLEGSIPVGPYARVFARRFENMSENYQVRFDGTDRVVARQATRLAVLPHDHDRFGYRLWLDSATGLLLRSELHDFEGASLEIFQFTSLKLGDEVLATDLEPAKDNVVVRRLTKSPNAESSPDESSRPQWRVRWVPPGFHLTSTDFRRSTDDRQGVNTLVYSDGLAAFSVFIEAMPEAGAGSVISRSGATVVLTHLASAGDGDHLVTVVGEVPVGTARRIASGVAQHP